jgi:hypothetical protein
MNEFRKQCPEVATSATEDEVRPFFFASLLDLTRAFTPNYNSLQAPEEATGFQILTPQFIAAAHEGDCPCSPGSSTKKPISNASSLSASRASTPIIPIGC